MVSKGSRITPLTPVQFRDRVREATGADEAESSSSTPNILMTVAHHPTLLVPFLGFAAALATRGVLPRRESELLALRASWNCRSAFEWGHHVLYARAEGFGEDEIARIVGSPDAPGWSLDDQALLRAADELHRDHIISDETWERLRTRWNDAQLVEIPFVVGNYTMLSMVARSTDVALEPGLPALPAEPT